MSSYRKKHVVIEATRWMRNGDHPQDRVGEIMQDPVTGEPYEAIEGRVVRFFRRPEPAFSGDFKHLLCGETWDRHGWIDTLEGGHTVCPGDYVVTTDNGEYYPMKASVFHEEYESVPDPKPTAEGKYLAVKSLSQAMQIENAGGGPA